MPNQKEGERERRPEHDPEFAQEVGSVAEV